MGSPDRTDTLCRSRVSVRCQRRALTFLHARGSWSHAGKFARKPALEFDYVEIIPPSRSRTISNSFESGNLRSSRVTIEARARNQYVRIAEGTDERRWEFVQPPLGKRTRRPDRSRGSQIFIVGFLSLARYCYATRSPLPESCRSTRCFGCGQ